MLTKWAKKCLSVYGSFGKELLPAMSTGSTGYLGLIPAVDNNGNNYYIGPFSDKVISTNLITDHVSGGTSGIAFGTDDHTESENDYFLGHIISSGISISGTPSRQYIHDVSNDMYSAYYDFTISNDTDSPITIREIGVFNMFYMVTNKGDKIPWSNNARTFMVDRTVLPEPITIPAGEARIIRYQFDYYVGD